MDDSPLGRRTEYPDRYAPELLYAIPRDEGRRAIGIRGSGLPFGGADIWNAYEVSWLDPKGKPVVAVGELRVPASSPKIVESKSLKLYLNSLSGTAYASDREVARLIGQDLEHQRTAQRRYSRACGACLSGNETRGAVGRTGDNFCLRQPPPALDGCLVEGAD